MEIQKAKAVVASMVVSDYPVLLVGAPGVGKTQIGKDVAAALGMNRLVTKPVVKEPTDYRGLPFPAEDRTSAAFLPIGDIAKLLKCTEPTLWCIEDIGQATEAVQGALMEIIDEREIEGHRIPDCVRILATTNGSTHMSGVKSMIEPLKSRFYSIIEIDPDLKSWTLWAIDEGLPEEIIGFVNFKPELFNNFKPTRELKNSPSSRGWAHAAEVYRGLVPLWRDQNLGEDVVQEVLAGAVGHEATAEFLAYCKVFKGMPGIHEVLLNPETVSIPDAMNAAHALCTALIRVCEKDNISAIAKFTERLYKTYPDYAAYLITSCGRKSPEIAAQSDYIRVRVGVVGNATV